MKILMLLFSFITSTAAMAQSADYSKLSQDILYAAKLNTSTDELLGQLAKADQQSLKGFLNTDNVAKAFWLNIYNAFVQIELHKDVTQYQHKNKFFRKKSFAVAGRHISLDIIEHGILRRSKVKWGLGYIGKIFPSKFEKKFRVDSVDSRIHFALNCGAKSCPPILFYEPALINHQLDMVAKNYIGNEMKFSPDSSLVYLPKTMNWFRGDFAGKSGMMKLLHRLQLIPADISPSISFKNYNWQLSLKNYWEE